MTDTVVVVDALRPQPDINYINGLNQYLLHAFCTPSVHHAQGIITVNK